MGGRYVRCAILGARDGIYFLCIWNSIDLDLKIYPRKLPLESFQALQRSTKIKGVNISSRRPQTGRQPGSFIRFVVCWAANCLVVAGCFREPHLACRERAVATQE